MKSINSASKYQPLDHISEPGKLYPVSWGLTLDNRDVYAIVASVTTSGADKQYVYDSKILVTAYTFIDGEVVRSPISAFWVYPRYYRHSRMGLRRICGKVVTVTALGVATGGIDIYQIRDQEYDIKEFTPDRFVIPAKIVSWGEIRNNAEKYASSGEEQDD